MKTLALILLLSSAKVGWAEFLHIQSDNKKITVYYLKHDEYSVVHNTSAVTLDEFVKSGKFCEWRGKHEWKVDIAPPVCHPVGDFKNGYRCAICGHCYESKP